MGHPPSLPSGPITIRNGWHWDKCEPKQKTVPPQHLMLARDVADTYHTNGVGVRRPAQMLTASEHKQYPPRPNKLTYFNSWYTTLSLSLGYCLNFNKGVSPEPDFKKYVYDCIHTMCSTPQADVGIRRWLPVRQAS